MRLLVKFRALVPITGLALSLPLASMDMMYANEARSAANEMRERAEKEGGNIYFSGHWGLQYYMEASGFQALDYYNLHLKPGRDFILFPVMNNSNTSPIPEYRQVAWRRRLENTTGVTCVSLKDQAGFYSSLYGILPFGIALNPVELYLLMSHGPL